MSDQNAENVKELKFRTQGGQVLGKIYSHARGGCFIIAFAEVYTARQQGTVDGQENIFANIETKKFDEVQKNITISAHNHADYVLLTNTQYRNSLYDAAMKIVQEGVKKGTEVARKEALNAFIAGDYINYVTVVH